jgi:hypothetical protein
VTEDTKFLVHASYLEIYNEDVRDLLGKDVKSKLELKEHPERGVYVQGKDSLIQPQSSADNIICIHFLKNCSVDGKTFEEKMFILTTRKMSV